MIIFPDEIIFRKSVIQLLNPELGKFVPAQDLFMMQPDVIELVKKQLCYLLNSDELKPADWNIKEPVFQELEQMNEKDDKAFIQTSGYLADRLFDIMCDSIEIPSADLLCLSFQAKQEIYYALIKLNYQNSFMHELMKYDNKEIIRNIKHKKILPLGKRISEGIIFNLSLQKVMLKEKKYEMLNGDKIYYLSERFLKSTAQTEAKKKYQILSRTIKTINRKYPEDGLKHQMDTKSKLCKIFEEDQEFSINKIGDELFGQNPQKRMEFDEKMERYNMQYDSFTIEKEETIKDLGYIRLQTDNDIEIKIPIEQYQTKGCVKVEEEPGGTKTIVMKNIEQVTVQ